MPVVNDHLELQTGCYASIFISERPLEPAGYAEAMAHVMTEAENMAGYIGFESLRDGRDGIFISYWRNAEAVEAWSRHSNHQSAKARGVSEWYDAFRSVTCRIEKTRFFRRAVVNPQ
jgi:heme-degrading monooxygenase HmoA